MFLVCLRAPPSREILIPFLAVLFTLSFVLTLALVGERGFPVLLPSVPDHPLV